MLYWLAPPTISFFGLEFQVRNMFLLAAIGLSVGKYISTVKKLNNKIGLHNLLFLTFPNVNH